MMIESKTILTRDDGTFLASAQSQSEAERAERQRRMMAAALALLVIGLAAVLYLERDFWFSHEEEAQTQSAAADASVAVSTQKSGGASHKKKHSRSRTNDAVEAADPGDAGDAAAVTANRTVLPPLQVEVIASTYRRTIRPATNPVLIDLRDGSASSRSTPPAAQSDASRNDSAQTAASITNAAERAEVSSLTTDVVTHSVVPAYPTLARQMKVQGSVILEALIGRDGLIQDLQVVSGPPILAGAAQEAVKQWHFKPHFKGTEAVETQTKITVNFTISTN
jgi:TonB family protein